MKKLAGLLLCAMAIAACDGLVSPSRYAKVIVEVKSRNGIPAPGVDIILYTGQRPIAYGVTDSAGTKRFEHVPEGVYGVVVQPNEGWTLPEHLFGGPATNVAQFALPRDSVYVVRFTFIKIGPGVIAARVTDNTGTPLPDVTVTLYSPVEIIATLQTDQAGRARFAGVAPGEYGLYADRPAALAAELQPAVLYSDGLRIVEEGDSVGANLAFTRVQR